MTESIQDRSISEFLAARILVQSGWRFDGISWHQPASWGIATAIQGDTVRVAAQALIGVEDLRKVTYLLRDCRCGTCFSDGVDDLKLRLRAALAVRPEPVAKRWKHAGRGTFYTEIGRGKLQAQFAPLDMTDMVIYQGDDGALWCRPVEEFEDGGRFVPVEPNLVEPCPNATHMGKHACQSRRQCWEPCGELGRSAEHVRRIEPVAMPVGLPPLPYRHGFFENDQLEAGYTAAQMIAYARAAAPAAALPIEPYGYVDSHECFFKIKPPGNSISVFIASVPMALPLAVLPVVPMQDTADVDSASGALDSPVGAGGDGEEITFKDLMHHADCMSLTAYALPRGGALTHERRWLDERAAFESALLASGFDKPRPDGFPASRTERHLRRLLCLRVGGLGVYMDDGEASDCTEHPFIDFMRDSVEMIEAKITERGAKRYAKELAAAAQAAGGQPSNKTESVPERTLNYDPADWAAPSVAQPEPTEAELDQWDRHLAQPALAQGLVPLSDEQILDWAQEETLAVYNGTGIKKTVNSLGLRVLAVARTIEAVHRLVAGAVPVLAGWQLVPLEPTPEMIAASSATPGMMAVNDMVTFDQVRRGYRKTWPGEGSPMEQAYRAMLVASPTPPLEQP